MSLKDAIKKAAPYATAENIEKYEPLLKYLMERHGIDTPLRQRHFLAQLLHESGQFRYVREIASGSAYEGRKDLGNTHTGDGVKFKGRGLIQLTGRSNYQRASQALFGDERLTATPEIVEQSVWAVAVSCWFWETNKLNEWADRDDIVGVTRRINGGTTGLAERQKYYANLTDIV